MDTCVMMYNTTKSGLASDKVEMDCNEPAKRYDQKMKSVDPRYLLRPETA